MVGKVILVLAGGLLVLVGIFPFTQLVFLLVYYHGPSLIPIKLQFWQTQTIGAAIALLGFLLLWAAVRKPGAPK
jgi:hypothetical protein